MAPRPDNESAVVDDVLAFEDRQEAERRAAEHAPRGRQLQLSDVSFGERGRVGREPFARVWDTPTGIAVRWLGMGSEGSRDEVWGNVWSESQVQGRPLDVELVRRVYSRATAVALDWVEPPP